ncbi:MAG: hypothetical protein V4621_00825 [Pseudomonadota bacterium]
MSPHTLRDAFLHAALPVAAGMGLTTIFQAASFNNDMLSQAGLIKNTPPQHEVIDAREKETLHTMQYVHNMTGMGG